MKTGEARRRPSHWEGRVWAWRRPSHLVSDGELLDSVQFVAVDGFLVNRHYVVSDSELA